MILATASAMSQALGLSTANPGHTNISTLFNARGLAQPNNFKWALRRPSENPGVTANPANGQWWNRTAYWKLDYTHATGALTWSLFNTVSDRTNGTPTLASVSRAGANVITPSAGKEFVGFRLDVKALDATTTATVSVFDVSINGNAVATMDNTVTGKQGDPVTFVAGTAHYFTGPLADFSIIGTTTMAWTGSLGSGSSDRVTFELNGLEANPVPEPATLAALGLGATALLRRRKKV